MRAEQSDQTYLWTLFRPYVEPAMGFGHLKELAGWLGDENLPGIAPSAWIVEVCLEADEAGHFRYWRDIGGAHEWTIVNSPAVHP